MERFCCNALEVYCFSALFRFLSSLQALRADGLLPQRVHCGYSTTPVLCLSCSLSVAFLPLSLSLAWGMGKHGYCILNPSFYPHSKGPLEKQESLDQAKSSLLWAAWQRRWIQVKRPKLPLCISFSCSLPGGRGWHRHARGAGWRTGQPGRGRSSWGGHCTRARFGWRHLEGTGPPAHFKASGLAERAVRFSWCRCSSCKLPSTLASLAFPLTDVAAKRAVACAPRGLVRAGCSLARLGAL